MGAQDQRRALDADVADAVDQFLGRLADCYEGRSDFTLVLDDPAGEPGKLILCC